MGTQNRELTNLCLSKSRMRPIPFFLHRTMMLLSREQLSLRSGKLTSRPGVCLVDLRLDKLPTDPDKCPPPNFATPENYKNVFESHATRGLLLEREFRDPRTKLIDF